MAFVLVMSLPQGNPGDAKLKGGRLAAWLLPDYSDAFCLSTTEPFFPLLKQDIDLVWWKDELHDAEPEVRVLQQGVDEICAVHIIGDRLRRIHVRLQRRPLGTCNGLRIGFGPAGRRRFLPGGLGGSGLLGNLDRVIGVDSVAGIALHAHDLFPNHGDNRMIQYSVAAGTPRFNSASG